MINNFKKHLRETRDLLIETDEFMGDFANSYMNTNDTLVTLCDYSRKINSKIKEINEELNDE